ncbi:hypothetical protein DI392_17680 [Vibrio albus]|uniref:DUF6701 domain-containing protein n=2 Tax=Vibrio albus TaxID=2200953 RepID=A0A2U3B5D9_9VIBR|nr:hypothetical protein DI392_17680 [Vibrio albus]
MASQLANIVDCSKLNGSQDVTVQFDVTGPNSDQFVNFEKNNSVINLWAAKKESGSVLFNSYEFEAPVNQNEMALLSNERYEVRITSGKWDNHDTYTYYRRQVQPEITSWQEIATKVVTQKFPGNHEANGVEVTQLQCGEEVQVPVDPPTLSFSASDNLCEYFPQPAQSWKNGSGLTISNTKNGSDAYHIGGWSSDYIDSFKDTEMVTPWDPKEINTLKIGFDSLTGWGVQSPDYTTSCEYGHCRAGGRKAADPLGELNPDLDKQAIDDEFPEEGALSLGLWDTGLDQCPADDSGIYCKSSINQDGDVVVTIKSNLKSLTVQGSSQQEMIVEFEPGSGSYGRLIEHYTVDSNVTTKFSNAGIYTFNTVHFNTSDGTVLDTGKDIVWLITGSVSFSNTMTHENSGTPDDFIIFAPFAGSSVTVKEIINPYYGLILADKLSFTNSIELHGAVTSNSLGMASRHSTIIGQSQCFNVTPEPEEPDYAISMTPSSSLALMCGDDQPEFSITTTNNGDAESLAVTASLSSDSSDDVSDLFDIAAVSGDGNYPNFTSDTSGNLELSISVKDLNQVDIDTTYTLTVTMDDDSSKSVSSTFKFVPYKFDLEDADTVSVIANKSESIDLHLLACSADEPQLVTSYSGKPEVSHYINTPTGGLKGGLTYEPEFTSSGTASADLTITESGRFTVNLSDSFDCSGFTGCPEDGTTEVTGSFTVLSRPWTFALCDADTDYSSDDDPMNGNISSATSSGYTAAGNEFRVKIYPINWQGSSEADNGYIAVDAYCDDLADASDSANDGNSVITENFFLDGVGVDLTHIVADPAPDEPNVSSGEVSGDVSFAYDSNESGESYYLASLKWSEVGVLRLQVEPIARYLNMNIDSSYRHIGRFYPSYIEITDDAWTYSAGHDGFAYMEQPVEHSFAVEAKNTDGNSVVNYRTFADSLKVSLRYYAIDSDANSLLGRISGIDAGNWEWIYDADSSVSQLALDTSDFEFIRETDSTNLTATVQDGPYLGNTFDDLSVSAYFGLQVILNPDEVVFKDNTDKQLFSHQPNFLYGRMKLSDVGGNTGTEISVPLETQYWNGSGFVTNTSDSGSQFDADDFCWKEIWSNNENSSTAVFSVTSGGSEVNSGRFNDLISTHSGGGREQVRLWLRLGDAQPEGVDECLGTISDTNNNNRPWLRYNWRSVGDEDPSAILVFGTYRGNDRVIFRGEPNMFGQ